MITVRDGNLDNLEEGLGLIRSKIPEKSNVSLEEILERLGNKDCHIKIAEINGEVEGINVWYGPYKNENDCYLWLGAVREPGKGTGSLLMEEVLKDMRLSGYSEVHVKAKSPAKGILDKYGFVPYEKEENGTMRLKRTL